MKQVKTLQRIETLDVSDETKAIPADDTAWLEWLDGRRDEPPSLDEPLPFELTPKALEYLKGNRA